MLCEIDLKVRRWRIYLSLGQVCEYKRRTKPPCCLPSPVISKLTAINFSSKSLIQTLYSGRPPPTSPRLTEAYSFLKRISLSPFAIKFSIDCEIASWISWECCMTLCGASTTMHIKVALSTKERDGCTALVAARLVGGWASQEGSMAFNWAGRASSCD